MPKCRRHHHILLANTDTSKSAQRSPFNGAFATFAIFSRWLTVLVGRPTPLDRCQVVVQESGYIPQAGSREALESISHKRKSMKRGLVTCSTPVQFTLLATLRLIYTDARPQVKR